jgi:ATP-binding cassette subfamily F protein 3
MWLSMNPQTTSMSIRMAGRLIEYKSVFVIISHDCFLDRRHPNNRDRRRSRFGLSGKLHRIYQTAREAARPNSSRRATELIARMEDFIRRNIAGQKTKQAKPPQDA